MKMNKKEKSEIIRKLRPYWKEFRKLEIKHSQKIDALEKEMTGGIKSKIRLEFFYVDGSPVGIGAQDLSDRKSFPLIHDSEL